MTTKLNPVTNNAANSTAAYARRVLSEELDAALDELPDEQREVFVAHELMGYSFKELAAQTGVSVNTLLSRKHHAILHLRERLQVQHPAMEAGRPTGASPHRR